MYFTINSHFNELRKNWEEKKKLPPEIIESIEKMFSYWTQEDKIPFGIRIETTKGEKIIGLAYAITVEIKGRPQLSKVVVYLERPQWRRKKKGKKTTKIKEIVITTKKIQLLDLKKIEFFKTPSYYQPLLPTKERKKFLDKHKAT